MPTRVLENVPVGDATSEGVAAAPRSQAIMASGGPNSAAALTLTMGGVDFVLEPFMNPEGAVTFRAMGPNGATLKLNNFTGELRVIVGTTTGEATQRRPPFLLQRQDSSVTPSPSDNNHAVRTTPPCQQRLLQHGQGLAISPGGSSLAPTPIMANGNSQKCSKNSNDHVTRNHATTHQVEQVVTANRSSPLPYHSPVKRTRSNTGPITSSTSGSKRSKIMQDQRLLLSQHFSPSPIALGRHSRSKSSIPSPHSGCSPLPNLPLQQSPLALLSQQELGCSPTLQRRQQQPSDCSQRSDSGPNEKEEQSERSPNSKEPELLNEDSNDDDGDYAEEEKHETVQQILERQSEDEDEEDEKSVATLKPDDYDDDDDVEEAKEKTQEKATVTKETDDEGERNNNPMVQEKTMDEASGEVNANKDHEEVTEENKTTESIGDDEKGEGMYQPMTAAEDTAQDDNASSTTTSTVSRHESPCARWGHTMTMVDHNRLLVYGGQTFRESEKDGIVPATLSDVHVFEVSKKSWFTPLQSSDAERHWPRQWHSATFLPERQLLICFGGEAMNPKTGRVTTSDKNNLMVLDTEILLVCKILLVVFSFFS
jgi:Galactose oxidase, central domain